jgi:hypothetical protein
MAMDHAKKARANRAATHLRLVLAGAPERNARISAGKRSNSSLGRECPFDRVPL